MKTTHGAAGVFWVALALLAAVQADCDEGALVELVKECARQDAEFLACLSSKTQCACLRAGSTVRSCLGDCLMPVENALCQTEPLIAPTFPQHVPVPKLRTWRASQSRFLKYAASKPELDGVDGVYLVSPSGKTVAREKFFLNSTLSAAAVHVLDSVRSAELTVTDSLRRTFNASHGDFAGLPRERVARALAHLWVWRHVAATTNELHLVCEDTALFAPDFVQKWNGRYRHALPSSAKLVFLGGVGPERLGAYHSGRVLQPVNSLFATHVPSVFYAHDYVPGLDSVDVGQPTRRFLYNASAYIISSDAARELVDMVARLGFACDVPRLLYRLMDRFADVYAPLPLLVSTQDTDEESEDSPMLSPEEIASAQDATAAAPASKPDKVNLPTIVMTEFSEIGSTPTFLINLDRSVKRLRHFEKQAAAAGLRFSRFSAVDGEAIDPAELVKAGVVGPEFAPSARGSMACGLSHHVLAEMLSKSAHNYFLIFEDDAAPAADFVVQANALLSAAPAGWDVLHLGCFPWACSGSVQGSVMQPNTECVSGMHAYFLSRAGAAKLLQHTSPLREQLHLQLRPHFADKNFVFYCAARELVPQNWELPNDRVNGDQYERRRAEYLKQLSDVKDYPAPLPGSNLGPTTGSPRRTVTDL
eukprot:m.59933 g.59933  ORF g.59933 m.59933 type:complete len:646 (+) comp16047_c0_seq1:133-2070(+)